MAYKCDICGKDKSVGMQVSHSHIRTKKTWTPNLQPVRTIVNGKRTRLRVCTRCLRSGKVQRVV